MSLTDILIAISMIWTFGMITYCVVRLVKNNNTYRQRQIIHKAIIRYQQKCRSLGWVYMVVYEDMEPYNSTDDRLWDWGYTRILPPQKNTKSSNRLLSKGEVMDAKLIPLCPKCGESYYMERYRTTTCIGWYPVYKDGILVNQNPNKTTVHCSCLNCHEDFSFTEE